MPDEPVNTQDPQMLERHAATLEAHPVEAPPGPPSVVDNVITDIRWMFHDDEPVHREIVADLRDPNGRGVMADDEKHKALSQAVAMRAELADAGIDPGAPQEPESDAALQVAEYRDHLSSIHRARGG